MTTLCAVRTRFAGRSLLGVLLAGTLIVSAAGPAGTTTGQAEQLPADSPPLEVVLPLADCGELAGRAFELATGETARLQTSEIVAATDTSAEHCKVSGFVEPQHLFEMTLPTTTWTQRYLQYGCGGFCGLAPSAFPLAAFGCEPLAAGEFAAAYGNGGHVAGDATDGSWAVDRALFEDYAYESEYQLSLVAGEVIETFYGQPPTYRYFNSCSNGGRQALVLTQRFPGAFDGVLAGAPANITVPLVVFSLGWSARANTAADGSELITAADLPGLHDAALAACDELDGLADGLITDPPDCPFDPGGLQCASGATEGCLTAEQVEAARRIYQGARDENGLPFYPGGGMPVGSELAWAGWIVSSGADDAEGSDEPPVPAAEAFARNWLRFMSSLDQTVSHDLDALTFDRATYDQLRSMDAVAAADDPDLSAFRDAGGKLIIWHGWNDPAIPAPGVMAYFEAVTEAMGGDEATAEFARLYLVGGMYHCGGGDGPDRFDLLTPLLGWVEDGVAPGSITATELDEAGAAVRTRPVYPYPDVPAYDGTGDPDDATSFSPAPDGAHDLEWVSEFGTSGRFWCRLEDGELVCSEGIEPNG